MTSTPKAYRKPISRRKGKVAFWLTFTPGAFTPYVLLSDADAVREGLVRYFHGSVQSPEHAKELVKSIYSGAYDRALERAREARR